MSNDNLIIDKKKLAITCEYYLTDRQKASFLYKMKDKVFNCSTLKVESGLVFPRERVPMPPDLNKGIEAPEDRKKSFTHIFKEKVWKGQKEEENAEKLTGSGRGSTIVASRQARATISQVIEMVKEYLGQ